LPVLTIGAWFSMVDTINESALLGLGAPSYLVIANSLRFVLLVVGLPLSLKFKGLFGGIVVLVLVDVFRYVPVYIGQRRHRFSFAVQDIAMTLAMFAMTGVWELLRWGCGFGTSFDSLFK